MDIYQLIITHNRAWTVREIYGFSIVLFAVIVLMIFLLKRGKICLLQAFSVVLLLLFLAIVFGSTVFTRNPEENYQYKLELFWSWKKVFLEQNQFLLKENLLNMLLLLPMGFLLPFIFWSRVSWIKGVAGGAAVSVTIEICQLIFRRGLFEWDDIIHNGLGCMVGCLIGNAIFRNLVKKDRY